MQLLIAVALEISNRVSSGRMLVMRPGSHEPSQPSTSSGLAGTGDAGDEEQGGQDVAFQQCAGKCCVCGNDCVRVASGHKHCKCQRHMNWR